MKAGLSVLWLDTVITYVYEMWTLIKRPEEMSAVFEVLRKIYAPMRENYGWRIHATMN